ERAYALRELGRELSLRFHSKMVGRIIEVIVESEHKERRGFVFGRASNYVRVLLPADLILVGEVIHARVISACDEYVVALPLT
ncbi:MAG: TRAM domain-containing protein, partial [Actinomycetota bacterium]|nr:TRAM domain-containing protein [Actinomycetota bacterium]